MHLGAIGDDQFAVGEPCERVELIKEELPEASPLLRVLRRVDDAQCEATCDSAGLHREPGRTLAASVGGIGTSTEHLLREYTAASGSGTRTVGPVSGPRRPIESACRAGEMADAAVLKTAGGKPSSGFNSRARYVRLNRRAPDYRAIDPAATPIETKPRSLW